MTLPWFRWWPTDFAGDPRVRLMGWEARAAYRELLDLSWGVGPLPDPEGSLEALGLPRELWRSVAPCWTKTPSGWVQGRLERERELARKRATSARNAAGSRWGNAGA